MRLIVHTAAISLIAISLAGCHSKSSSLATPSATNGRSLAEMEAEYARLRDAHQKKCLTAPPEQIKANQAICEQERQSMAPLGNAIIKAEQEAAQHTSNP